MKGWTAEELEAMRMADEEIERSFVAASKEERALSAALDEIDQWIEAGYDDPKSEGNQALRLARKYIQKLTAANVREIGPVLTNADRIRAMSDEELAELMVYQERCPDGYIRASSENCYARKHHGSCEDCWLDWLKSPAEEDGKT